MRFVLAAAALLLAGAPSHAGPKKLPLLNVTCGHVITESVRIANSLQDCPADGLVVGAPGVTIDRGGHRIDGVDAGSASTTERVTRTSRSGTGSCASSASACGS